jgi:radical SAM superfamily enzyme YgiQ (UPF0313 family)
MNTLLNALNLNRRWNSMNVLLISANTETINMPTLPMGLGLVAAATQKAGHQVRFVDLMIEDDSRIALSTAIAENRPDVIGISIRNIDNQDSARPCFLLEAARSVVAQCKALSQSPVVLGGAGYSMFPESALEYLGADMGIQGEGEAPFINLLEILAANGDPSEVPGLFLRGRGCRVPRGYVSTIDDWPFPDPAIFNSARFKDPSYYLPFQTRRGCPLRCSYCATFSIEGTRIRMRGIDLVVKELARWRDAGFRQIFFVDNTFNLPPHHAQELCNRLIEANLGLNWRAIFYPGRTDPALIQSMARAGCTEVSLGFESGNPQVLSWIGKRFNPDDVRRTSKMFRDVGIRRMGFLLLGGPKETRETVLESLRFADSLNLEAMKVTVGIRIYPFTRLADEARTDGMIDSVDDLLHPRFYIRQGLEPWLRQTVAEWTANRSTWKA